MADCQTTDTKLQRVTPPGNPSEQLCFKGNGYDSRLEARKANGMAISEKSRHAVGYQLDRAERL
jgi:hypothetical protein